MEGQGEGRKDAGMRTGQGREAERENGSEERERARWRYGERQVRERQMREGKTKRNTDTEELGEQDWETGPEQGREGRRGTQVSTSLRPGAPPPPASLARVP